VALNSDGNLKAFHRYKKRAQHDCSAPSDRLYGFILGSVHTAGSATRAIAALCRIYGRGINNSGLNVFHAFISFLMN